MDATETMHYHDEEANRHARDIDNIMSAEKVNEAKYSGMRKRLDALNDEEKMVLINIIKNDIKSDDVAGGSRDAVSPTGIKGKKEEAVSPTGEKGKFAVSPTEEKGQKREAV